MMQITPIYDFAEKVHKKVSCIRCGATAREAVIAGNKVRGMCRRDALDFWLGKSTSAPKEKE